MKWIPVRDAKVIRNRALCDEVRECSYGAVRGSVRQDLCQLLNPVCVNDWERRATGGCSRNSSWDEARPVSPLWVRRHHRYQPCACRLLSSRRRKPPTIPPMAAPAAAPLPASPAIAPPTAPSAAPRPAPLRIWRWDGWYVFGAE